MFNRFRGFNSMAEAQNWYVEQMLAENNSKSERIVNSTKLTDLIFAGLSFDDTLLKGDLDDRPVNTNALSEDLFSALFSPSIRRRDENSIRLKERAYNIPVFDRIVRDDRFDVLKALCEDKEVISYEAVIGFFDVFDDRLYDMGLKSSKYSGLIKLLSEQVDKTAEEISKRLNTNYSSKKMIKLYNRLFAKMSQISALEKKLKNEALLYTQALSDIIDEALDNALQRAISADQVFKAWGEMDGNGKNIKSNKELLDHVKNSSKLTELAKMLGRYKELVLNKRKNSFSYGLGEKYDITHGNDISNCLSSELALLGAPETEILFMRKFEQQRLMQYRKRMPIVKGKGDMIVLVDESGSTQSVALWAKAFALALLDIASKDKRKFAFVHFSSEDEVKTDIFEPGKYTAEDMLSCAEHFFDGGTDFEAPLKEAMRLIDNGFENADITIITDGECKISDQFAKELKEKLLSSSATLTGIMLDKNNDCGESLEPFCDTVYHSKDIIEDKIAIDILNRKAG